MFKFKKLVATIIAVMLIMASFAGCNPSGGGGGEVDERDNVAPLRATEVRMLLRTADGQPPADMQRVTNEINHRLRLDGRPYTVRFFFFDETEYLSRLALSINERYDLAFMHISDFAGAMQTNLLRDVRPFLEKYGQNLLDSVPQHAWNSVAVRGEDRDRYFLIPRNMPVSDAESFTAIRRDWMDDFGMDRVETLAQFEQYMMHAHNRLAGTTGAFVTAADNHWNILYRHYAPSYFFPFVNWAFRPLAIDVDPDNLENGRFVVRNFFRTHAFEDIIARSRHYYNLGYTSPHSMPGTEALFTADQIAMVWNTLLKTNERIDSFRATQLNALGNARADIYDVYLNPDDPRFIVNGVDNAMGLLAMSENPNEAIDFLAWVRYSQENHDLVNYGILGVNYNLTEDGRLDMTGITDSLNFSARMPFWAFNDIRFARWSKNVSEEYIESRKNWDTADNVVVSALNGFRLDLSDTAVSVPLAQVSAAAFDTVTQLIDGRWDASETVGGMTRLQRLLNDMDDAGMNALVVAVQAQVDAFMAAQ